MLFSTRSDMVLSSSSVLGMPSFGTMKATTFSPRCLSGTPMTQDDMTRSSSLMMPSICEGYTLYPEVTMILFILLTKYRWPSSSMYPASPVWNHTFPSSCLFRTAAVSSSLLR